MTLREAVETGKPFKRPSWKNNFHGEPSWVRAVGNTFRFVGSGNSWSPYVADISATDFEVKSVPRVGFVGRNKNKYELTVLEGDDLKDGETIYFKENVL